MVWHGVVPAGKSIRHVAEQVHPATSFRHYRSGGKQFFSIISSIVDIPGATGIDGS